MVLGVKMKIYTLVLSVFCICGGFNKEALGKVTDSTNIQSYKLTIESKNNNCVLIYQDFSVKRQLVMFPKPPCYFLRRESIKPQSFSYDDIGVKAVLIVVGTLINEEIRKQWNLSNNIVCGEETQAIIFKDDSITLSKTVLKGGVACRNKGVDEKNFWFFAHESN
jgi:hypothetical protein